MFRGYVDRGVLWQTVVVTLLSIAGVQLGVIVSRRIPTVRFRRLVAIALIMVSCLMIWRGQPEVGEPDLKVIEIPAAATEVSEETDTRSAIVV